MVFGAQNFNSQLDETTSKIRHTTDLERTQWEYGNETETMYQDTPLGKYTKKLVYKQVLQGNIEVRTF